MSSVPAPDGKALKGRVRAAWKRLRGGSLSPGRAAASIAVGAFVGFLPVYGLHSVVVLAICMPLRLDSAISYLATHISNPLTAPFLFAFEMQVGSLVLTGKPTAMSLAAAKQLGFLTVGARLVLGASIVAPTVAVLAWVVTFLLTLRVQDAREPARAEARKRTMARYRRSGLAARVAVWWSLVTDPMLDSLRVFTGSFGRVVDLGCGAGHLSLSLLDRGRASSLLGIDARERVILLARSAAGNSAGFECAALPDARIPECDTVLVIDALHLLSPNEQDTVLANVACALSPGGRLILRVVAPGGSLRTRITASLARLAARRRGHSSPLSFRSTAEHLVVIERAGLACRIAPADSEGPLDRVLLVGEKPRASSAPPIATTPADAPS